MCAKGSCLLLKYPEWDDLWDTAAPKYKLLWWHFWSYLSVSNYNCFSLISCLVWHSRHGRWVEFIIESSVMYFVQSKRKGMKWCCLLWGTECDQPCSAVTGHSPGIAAGLGEEQEPLWGANQQMQLEQQPGVWRKLLAPAKSQQELLSLSGCRDCRSWFGVSWVGTKGGAGRAVGLSCSLLGRTGFWSKSSCGGQVWRGKV